MIRTTFKRKKTMRIKLYDKKALVRCTERELAELHQKAKKTKLSVSRFLVKSALSDEQILSAEEKEEIRQLRLEIRKIGVNLNQIAYSAHASRRGRAEPPAQEEIEDIQTSIEKVLKRLLEKL